MILGQQELGDLAWPDVRERPTVIVPIGSTEQHGPHLPLNTDTVVATAVAEAVASRVPHHAFVAPPVSYGSSGEHQSFAGTASIGSAALSFFVVELVRSLSTWAGRIILINAHGGNIAALSKAVPQLVAEQHNVAWLPCVAEGGDLHAGRTETSLMLHLRPDTVRLERSRAGNMGLLPDILPQLKAEGISAVSPSGVLGDPTGASAAEGRRSLEQMAENALRRISEGVTDKHGMLTANMQKATSQTQI
ncbi:mycofactocin biosynthesis peptidyl-dipeptidase MftE [Arthrobacter sp. 18067]|uniref:mycofactocin biosynthesis peptidyl-dipeptidase MftE n=1 Tax=Arthrobacter sp. 18067 TaxID=2681413 RepID=UPI001F2BD89A|nr:mycofactocin biosynthesis peptidyl-dipeptidase MftE [Arthrobacter sp. 18067]